jgi:tRNA-dihydrouridine synthase B
MTAGPVIGPHRLPGPVVLAPMAGISDSPFRRLCRSWGASLAASEMTTDDLSLRGSRKTRLRLRFDDESGPRVVQLAGSEPARLAEAARIAAGEGADIIDINMGCPAKKVCRRAAGSALLRDEMLVGQIIAAVVAAVAIPVTLKIRTGWDPESRNGPQIARIAAGEGVQALAVHGRTRACAFRGDAEYDTIRSIRRAVNIPVIANGDIDGPAKAAQVLEYTGADAVMVGRAARGQPWVFREIETYLRDGKSMGPPADSVRRDIILLHLDAMYRFYGEDTGVRVARKHLTWYFERLDAAAAFRQLAVRALTASDQMRITAEFFARRDDGEIAARERPSPLVSGQWREQQPVGPSSPFEKYPASRSRPLPALGSDRFATSRKKPSGSTSRN